MRYTLGDISNHKFFVRDNLGNVHLAYTIDEKCNIESNYEQVLKNWNKRTTFKIWEKSDTVLFGISGIVLGLAMYFLWVVKP